MGRQGEHLVARSLDGTRFVHVDVGRLGRQHAFVTGQQGVDDGSVGLRAAHQELHGCLRLSASLAYQVLGTGRIVVATISGRLLQIGFQQAAHHFGMCALHIVGIKMYHVSDVFSNSGAKLRFISARGSTAGIFLWRKDRPLIVSNKRVYFCLPEIN